MNDFSAPMWFATASSFISSSSEEEYPAPSYPVTGLTRPPCLVHKERLSDLA